MINFRYHVVSIVAVFLALATGIILGTTAIRQTLLHQLQTDARNFSSQNRKYRTEIGDLEAQLGALSQFGNLVVPGAVKGKLAGRAVALLIQDSTPRGTVDRVVDVLREAGAATPSRIRLTGAWSLADQADRDRLAEIAGVSAGDTKALLSQVGIALGNRLSQSGDASAETDLLRRLSSAGFLRIDNAASGLYPAAGTALVVLPSGIKDAAPAQNDFFVSLLRAVGSRRSVVVAEPYRADDSLCARVRSNGDLNASDGTVDHADTAPGQMSVVWALGALFDGGRALHYGVARGADAVAPELEP